MQDSKDEQWKRAMDYLNVVNELNYMTQIVIMLYEDPNKVTARECTATRGEQPFRRLTGDMSFHVFQDLSSEERFHVELHFSPGAKGCEEDKNLPSGYGYRPASREVMEMGVQCRATPLPVSCCAHKLCCYSINHFHIN